MSPVLWTLVLVQPSKTHYARAESSSGIPSLGGKAPKTPIIAGSVCGGVLLLAWIIGFSIYFRKRYRRRQLERAAAAIGIPPPDIKSRPLQEEIIIPPDPAILLGQHRPGYAFAEEHHELGSSPVAADPAVKGVDSGPSAIVGDVGVGGSRRGASGELVEDQRPLLTDRNDAPDIAVLRGTRGFDEDIGHE